MPDIDQIITTPAGLQLVYMAKAHRYKLGVNGEKPAFVPSVSTILDKALSKSLSGWAERGAVEGMLRLAMEGKLSGANVEDALELMKKRGLRYWQRRDAAAMRGTSVHEAFEALGEGKVPKVTDYPVHERGYIQAIARWWGTYEPKVLHNELMVGSAVHGYAGRMDLLAEVDGRVGVLDLKTSRAVRESHHFQTAGYRLAVAESGYPATSFGAIVRADQDGTFEYLESWATPSQFLALHKSYLAQKGFEAATPAEHKPKRKAKEAA